MGESDEEFRDEFKPLHVPAYFDPNDSKQDQVVFALAQIGFGSAEDVILELSKHQSVIDPAPYLSVLFDIDPIGLGLGGIDLHLLGDVLAGLGELHDAGAVQHEHDRAAVQADVQVGLVEGSTKEGGVDGHHRAQSGHGHTGGGGGTTPEPSSILLFGSGVLGMIGVLRRKLL